MKKEQQNRFDKIKKDLTTAKDALEKLKTELESDFDEMSEARQKSDDGEELNNQKDALENCGSSLEEALEYLDL